MVRKIIAPSETVSVDEALACTSAESPLFDPGTVGDEELSADLALRAALASIGETESDAKVIVYQIDEKTKKDVYLYDCSVIEFANSGLNEIQARYGAGEYRIRVYAPGRGVLTHRRVSIGAPKMPVAAVVAPVPPQPNIAEILAQQQATFMAGMREMMAAVRPTQQGPNVQETVALITALQGLSAPRRESDPLEMLTRLMTIQREIMPPLNSSGEIDSGAVILKAIDAFGKPLMDMAARNQAAQAAQAAPVTQVTQAAPNPVQLPAPVNQPTEDEMRFIAMKTMLLHAAKNAGDPYVYATNLLDFMGDETAELFLSAPNWREQLESMIPEAAGYREWIGKVRDIALDLLKGDEESDTVPSNQPGTPPTS